MNKIAVIALAGLAAGAVAQTANVTLSASATSIDTTSTNAADRTVRVSVDITGDMGLTTFDAVLSAFQGAGLFTVANATLDNPLLFTAIAGISDITDAGDLGVRAFGSGPLLSGTDIGGQQFSFDLVANQGAAGIAEVGVVGSGFSPIATFGLFSTGYGQVNVSGASINLVVPAPASLALLGLGGLTAARRRR
ncbi:MAG: hypothetical protein CMJ31_10500 [Phycisphaerae bacterium]|nr:hypothetical protein [Phycisphaerae bacterium]